MRPSTDDFQFIAGSLALDFVNTIGERLGEGREYLTSSAELTRWARLARVLPAHGRMSVTQRQLADVRTAREELYRLFRPIALGSRPTARSLAALNARLHGAAGARQLTLRSDVVRWEWAHSPRDAHVLLAQVFASAAELLVSGRLHSVRQCEGEGCGWLFVDRSRAGHRRWCSMGDCGNRAKARRHLAAMRRVPRRSKRRRY
ncbi:MAG TPA: ABATE domain-containing protein [Gemmatimonadaceae bacterium]